MRTPHSVFQNRRPLKQTRTLIVLLIVVALVAINSGPRSVTARSTATQSAVFQTTTVPMLAGTAQPINNGPGWQTDPHVSCEMVSYTNDDNQGTLQIQYFDIATNTDHIVPGNGANSLSDVSNGRIRLQRGRCPVRKSLSSIPPRRHAASFQVSGTEDQDWGETRWPTRIVASRTTRAQSIRRPRCAYMIPALE